MEFRGIKVSLNHNTMEYAKNPLKSKQQIKSQNMKRFVSENQYKLMIGSSLLMISFGFMVNSIVMTHAEKKALGGYYWVAYNGYAYQIEQYDRGEPGIGWKIRLN